ncbi:MAG: adventurous gliding motility lipoprotein CglB [Myxococcota bacterium]
MLRAALAACLAVFSAGCMTYDFEPVVPLAVAQTTQTKTVIARFLKPNVMLLVDKSGSMNEKIDPNCVSNCPTRISELRDAMSAFLTQSATDARMGLTFYPAGTGCQAASTVEVPLPPATVGDDGTDAALSMNASQINSRIQTVTPVGGTPTADSMAFVGTNPGLRDNADNRDDYILLLTDGLPNCNQNNPNQVCTCDTAFCASSGGCGSGVCQAQTDRCRCTLSSCSSQCAIGCLDQDASVAAATANRLNSIRTIVVGFGADAASSTAGAVLNAIAEAGNFPRKCPNGTDAECGSNNTCLPSGLCDKKYYQATDANELSAALRDIFDNIKGDECQFQLQAPPSRPELMAVIINGKNVTAGPDTWNYAAGVVNFTGQLCDDIKASDTLNPVTIEIRVVETF